MSHVFLETRFRGSSIPMLIRVDLIVAVKSLFCSSDEAVITISNGYEYRDYASDETVEVIKDKIRKLNIPPTR